jgi:glycosyltransferase involved in cell wall biosynthesis
MIADGRFPWGPGWRAKWSARARRATAKFRHPAKQLEFKRELAKPFRALAAADVIVTNSRAETDLLRADWPVKEHVPQLAVAYSGVDPIFFEGTPARGRALLGLDDFVLSVGRIEPRKNQLTLCRAMQKIEKKLVLVGAILPGNEPYAAVCRRALPNVIHVPDIPHEQLPDVYAAACAHVLLSWFETTGLVTLEALASGTPAVAADTSCVREYFSDGTDLVRPDRVPEIQSSIRKALRGPTGLERSVAARYTWDRTAREILAAYRLGAVTNSTEQ